MEVVAASIGTKLAVSGLSRVVKKLASNFGGDVTADEMEHLNLFVGYQIEALIREAKSDHLVKSKPLLDKLQAAALELEDLLDLYEYNQIEKQVRTSSSSNPIKKLISKSKEKLRTILPKSSLRIGLENLLKLVEQVEKLHPFIMSKKDTARPEANNTVTPKTSTLSSPFYGRGDQCDMILKLLLDESDLNSRTKNVKIIAIRGLGGAGKTATAQHLYNENKIVNYFRLRMWVHVTRGFDERSLIKETIESAEEKECGQISSLDVLQKKLKDSVSENKFLLVLDDVWEEDTTRLDILLTPLNQVGVRGSKIIVTTRTEKAANDLNAKHIVLLDELKDEDCWSLLKHYAFDDDEEIIEDHQELEYVGNQIINKVKHSPLALKVVGSSLRNKISANEWDKILRQEDILKDTMNLLLFSYQCLPLHLQRCFTYCSLFPKGYRFRFDVNSYGPYLISLWIAQGYIESTDESALEEVGLNYIEELLSYSFFEKYSDYAFIIHDLLHDVAEVASNKQCYRIEHHEQLHVPSTCIHLFLCITKNLISIDQSTILAISDILNLRNLRSLIVLKCPSYISIFESKRDIFQNLPKLRALYIEGQHMEMLSDPRIDKLKHLRYLHVRCNSQLLVSLVKLYQLQFLILMTDQKYSTGHLLANTLPHGFSNLTNLRTLQFYDKSFCEELDYLYCNSNMVNIEKLTSLQNLEKFHVDSFNGMKSLRDLPIGGSFSILNLENVKCKEEAEEAMLKQKKNIDDLIFVWRGTPISIDTCEQVLEGLEPHRNLERRLQIEGYQGVKLPKWMVKENWLPRLESLRLVCCTSLKIVPFLPPRLLHLKVEGCNELVQLACLSDRLSTVTLIRCPKLQALTNLSPTLTELWVDGCPNLMLPSTFNKSPSLCDLSFLTRIRLSLKGFSNIEALNLSLTVTDLSIEDCPKLSRLGNLQRCTSLRRLVILKCPMLRREEASLVEGVAEGDTANCLLHVENITTDDPILVLELVQQQAFSSTLSIRDCAAAELPNMEKLSSLGELHIEQCPYVESLPNLPASLRCLVIERCPKLTRLGSLQHCTSLVVLSILKCQMLVKEEASLVEGVAEGDIVNRLPHVDRIETDEPLFVFELVQEQAFSSITHLALRDCAAVTNLEMLSSLESLRIEDCPDVESLPNLPVSLQILCIFRCPILKEKYEEGGPLRNTISHIPCIIIF